MALKHAIAIALLLVPAGAQAQAARGRITGKTVDESGAPIPGAFVTVRPVKPTAGHVELQTSQSAVLKQANRSSEVDLGLIAQGLKPTAEHAVFEHVPDRTPFVLTHAIAVECQQAIRIHVVQDTRGVETTAVVPSSREISMASSVPTSV